jgi:hypothetical protein
MWRAGGVGKLRARYGKALKNVKLEDGEKVVWLKGKLKGCKVFTDFGEANRPAVAKIVMIFIGYQRRPLLLIRRDRVVEVGLSCAASGALTSLPAASGRRTGRVRPTP